ncbi:MAG: ribonuclease HI [Clostridia bacterium]|nr:ribonuclease HI [Clostridia bacterium]
MKTVDIYTDGACSYNPGPGGYGAVLIYGKTEKEISGYKEMTTNNEMELMAALKALQMLKHPCKVTLYSDSAYLVNAFLQGWIENWESLGWNKKKDELKNRQLWMDLAAEAKKHQMTWVKVKGHSDNEYNNRCDELARNEIIRNHKPSKE